MYYGFYDIFTRTNLKKKKKDGNHVAFLIRMDITYHTNMLLQYMIMTRTRHIWLETNWTHLIFEWTCFKYCEGKVKIC